MKNWVTQVDNLTKQFIVTFDALPAEKLNWKPNSQTWSIAQNVHHLITVNETYFPVLASLRNGTFKTPFLGNLNFVVRFFGKTVLNAVNPDRKKKMKTFPIWEPAASEIGGDILGQFKNHQDELKRQIESSEELISKGTVISSPANRIVVYKLETALDIIVYNEQRHFEQAKEVLQLLVKTTGH